LVGLPDAAEFRYTLRLDAGDEENVTRLAGKIALIESSWLTGAAIPLDGGLSAY
jgi:hypothetical protein